MAEIEEGFQPLTVGVPIAQMESPDGRLGRLAKGHLNISTLIAQGWVILPSPMNRLLPEYRSACKADLNVTPEPEAPSIHLSAQVHYHHKGKKNKYRR